LLNSSLKVAGIHASTPILFAWVGIPLLRFHPHPSHRRSIGQTIGLTAYPPQRAAIFTMPPHSNLPAYFRLRALFEASDISTTSEPTVPSGIVSFGPADPVCATHLGCKGSLTPRPEVGSLRSLSYGQRGSHITLVKDERAIPVPRHDHMKRGLLLETIAEAGLSREEFLELLR